MTSTDQPTWRPGDIANGHVLGDDGVWRPLPPAAPAPRQKGAPWYKHRPTLVLAIAGGLPLALLAVLFTVLDATGNLEGEELEVTGVTHVAHNPSSLYVVWKVSGEPGDTGVCSVHASDPSGAYDGTARFVEVQVPAEGWGLANATVEIDNEGAAWVSDVTVEC